MDWPMAVAYAVTAGGSCGPAPTDHLEGLTGLRRFGRSRV